MDDSYSDDEEVTKPVKKTNKNDADLQARMFGAPLAKKDDADLQAQMFGAPLKTPAKPKD